MSDELKPVRCGCGGEAIDSIVISTHFAILCDNHENPVPEYYVLCKKCGIRTMLYQTEAGAIQAWNRAMGVTWQKLAQTWHAYQVGENWYCENCGQQLTPYDWDWSGNE